MSNEGIQQEPTISGEAALPGTETGTRDHLSVDEPHTLSDLDMVMPNKRIASFLVYELESHHNVQLVIESLKKGLAEAVGQLPPLAAKIQLDRIRRPLRRLKPAALELSVRRFGPREYKSYQDLAKGSFLPGDFNHTLLLPAEASPDAEETPACFVQLNVIPGALVLSLSFNHVAMDGGSWHLATSLICKCSKACMEALPVPGSAFEYNRRLLTASPSRVTLPKATLSADTINYEIIDTASSTNGAPARPNEGVTIKSLTYRIEGSAAKKLKEACRPLNGVAYITTFSCVVGLLWRSIISIRAASKPHLLTTRSRFLHSVDLRKRPGQGIPDNYIGNAVAVASARPVEVADLLGPDGLSLAASSIRRSIEDTTVDSVANLTALGTMLGPTENILLRPSGGLLGANIMLTSWHFMDTGAYDFGTGPPRAVRTLMPPVPGFLGIFPDCTQQGGGRVYDLFVPLLENEQELLREDTEVRKWFQTL